MPPDAWAQSSATAASPARSATLTAATLRDRANARRAVTAPSYVCPKFVGCHGRPSCMNVVGSSSISEDGVNAKSGSWRARSSAAR